MTDPLMEIIPGKAVANTVRRRNDVMDAVQNVRNEFAGKPEVCHALVSSIIHLRRNIDVEHHTQCFYSLLGTHRSTLMHELDIRWLLSVCDTIVDVGTVTSSAIAMNIVQCINNLNIQCTIVNGYINYSSHHNEDHLLRMTLPQSKCNTWGGMLGPDIICGDMIYNMMNRLDKVVAQDELLNTIWCEIKDRSRTENIFINRLCALNSTVERQRYFQ